MVKIKSEKEAILMSFQVDQHRPEHQDQVDQRAEDPGCPEHHRIRSRLHQQQQQ